eukprot:4908326-Lingulodinium_polyedra.AAC.1
MQSGPWGRPPAAIMVRSTLANKHEERVVAINNNSIGKPMTKTCVGPTAGPGATAAGNQHTRCDQKRAVFSSQVGPWVPSAMGPLRRVKRRLGRKWASF